MRLPSKRLRFTALAAGLFGALVALSGCGGADSSIAMSGTPAVDFGEDLSGNAPSRIVSISPSATEMLFAIGADKQVVAVDAYSYFPEGTPVTDLNGWEPNVEAIINYDPDLVIMSYDPGDVVAGLEAVGVTAAVLPAAVTVADTYSQILELGSLTGRSNQATQVLADLRAEMDALAAEAAASGVNGLSYYHELDDTLFSVTSSTFVGEIYAMAGLINVADAAAPDGTAYGYPQLSAEFLVDAGPDLIFLADVECCAQTAEVVASRPGWESIPAIVEGQIVELPADVPSRWGPRIVDFLRIVVDSITAN